MRISEKRKEQELNLQEDAGAAGVDFESRLASIHS